VSLHSKPEWIPFFLIALAGIFYPLCGLPRISPEALERKLQLYVWFFLPAYIAFLLYGKFPDNLYCCQNLESAGTSCYLLLFSFYDILHPIPVSLLSFLYLSYIQALYWTTTTLTSTGYGDIAPNSSGQSVVSIFAMIFGQALFGISLALVASFMANSNAPKVIYGAGLDAAQRLLLDRKTPVALQDRVGSVFRATSVCAEAAVLSEYTHRCNA